MDETINTYRRQRKVREKRGTPGLMKRKYFQADVGCGSLGK